MTGVQTCALPIYKATSFTSTGIDDNATSTAITIDSAEEVLIGTTSQGRETNLAVVGTDQSPTGAWSQFGIYSNDSYAINKGGSMMFGGQDGLNVRSWFAGIKGAKENSTNQNYAGYLAFYTRPSGDTPRERLRLTSTGNVEVKTGNLVIGTSGKGIDFSADGNAAGMTSEVLDDYEEGTFTATLRGDSTEPGTLITANTAKYTKIGNTVHLTISFEAKNTTGYSGDMSISGMPFTNGTGRGIFNAATYYGATFSGYATGVLNDNGNSISIMDILSNLAWGAVQHRPASDTYVWISGTYNV